MQVINQQATWVTINLQAIENNVQLVRRARGVPIMAVVKADGYGHGAVPVAQAALRSGAEWCAVARYEEADELRQAGIQSPILILGYTPPGQLEEAINHQVSLTIWHVDQISTLVEAARRAGITAKVHLKVDSGMGRLGVRPDAALELAKSIHATPEIQLEGLFTHFARADEKDTYTTDIQEGRFRQVIAALSSEKIRPAFIHAANSAASLVRPSAAFDMVRLGIAMYGLSPSGECPLPAEFVPALEWKTVISHVKTLPPGSGVSYGHEYITREKERIGTVPIGYADGFRRQPGNIVLVHGKKTPVIGRVCMDQIMLQLDHIPEAKAGDEVVLIGKQGNACITADEVATRWKTINYEVVCGIGKRVPRLYSNR